ncbi:AAA family ATPase [Pseudomonas sp. NPDC089752]|uniref:AAA family ATPase n=1 Tax=Pseudomonas sp. NPDC089752 TaxID=3364472 RepID=UPI00380ECF78
MRIKAFKLHNIGRFESLEATFAQRDESTSSIVVFIGNNGAGKTSILQALSSSLDFFVQKLKSEEGSDGKIKDFDIRNSAKSACITLHVEDQEFSESPKTLFTWTRTGARAGMYSKERPQSADVTQLAALYRRALTEQENVNLPLIAYYPVERSVNQTPLKPRIASPSPQFEGYEGLSEDSIHFSRFFEWFRDREDHENELKASLPPDQKKLLDALIATESLDWSHDGDIEFEKLIIEFKHQADALKKTLTSSVQHMDPSIATAKDPQLNAVRQAIRNFMPGFSKLRVQRKPHLQLLIEKEGQTLDILQLSQGEKTLMALVGDIARRLAMLNPALDDPLEGTGIILIDEVDMHLHPKWQRNIIHQLTRTFPNCQFILTTHSPLVISDMKDTLVFALDDGELTRVASQYGQDANSVLLDVMETPIRNTDIDSQLNDLLDAIQDRKLEEARTLIQLLEQDLPISNFELAKAKLMLRKQELRIEKNS